MTSTLTTAGAKSVPRSVIDDTIPNLIEESLFLGSKAAAMNKAELRRLNITHILTLAGTIPPPYPQDFTYKVIPVTDRQETDIAQYFDECIEFIEEAKRTGGKVLVHCRMGISRSATIVMAYLMKMWGMSCFCALQHVKIQRPKVSPNPGFRKQLKQFEIILSDARIWACEDFTQCSNPAELGL